MAPNLKHVETSLSKEKGWSKNVVIVEKDISLRMLSRGKRIQARKLSLESANSMQFVRWPSEDTQESRWWLKPPFMQPSAEGSQKYWKSRSDRLRGTPFEGLFTFLQWLLSGWLFSKRDLWVTTCWKWIEYFRRFPVGFYGWNVKESRNWIVLGVVLNQWVWNGRNCLTSFKNGVLFRVNDLPRLWAESSF